jgi:hypothetical protein
MSLVPPGGIVLGSPIHAHTPPAVTQAAFQPPPPDAHLGTPIVEEGPSIPVPPSEPPTLPLITKK